MVSYKVLNTVIESPFSYTCHRIGNGDGCKAGAVIENTSSDTCHRIGNGDGCEAGAATESIFFDTCHRIGNCNRGEAGAARESTIADTCHIIHLFVNSNCFRNRNLSSISNITTCDFCCFFLCNKIIANTIDYDIIRQGGKGKADAEYERSNEESKSLFHNRRLQTLYLSHKVWRWLRVKNSHQSYNKRLLSPNFHSSFC